MTDLATRPGADEAPLDDVDHADRRRMPHPPSTATAKRPAYAWAAAEPPSREAPNRPVDRHRGRRRRRRPRRLVAGAHRARHVGRRRPRRRPHARVRPPMRSSTRLAETTIVLTGAGGDAEVTRRRSRRHSRRACARRRRLRRAPDVEPHHVVRRRRRRRRAHRRRDRDRRAARGGPDLYIDPVDATIAFDAATAPTSTTPAVPGTGIDVEAVRVALQDAFAAGETRVEIDADAAPVEPAVTTTCVAETSVASAQRHARHRRLLRRRRAHRSDRPRGRGSWLTVAPAERRRLRDLAPTRPRSSRSSTRSRRSVNRDAENAHGHHRLRREVLREEAAGISGRELGDTAGVASRLRHAARDGQRRVHAAGHRSRAGHHRRSRVASRSTSAQQHAYLFENGPSSTPGRSRRAGRLQTRAPAISASARS